MIGFGLQPVSGVQPYIPAYLTCSQKTQCNQPYLVLLFLPKPKETIRVPEITFNQFVYISETCLYSVVP